MPDEAPNTSQTIGKVTKYVVGTDWESYTKQLDFYFLANGVWDVKTKKAVLLTNLPVETYQLAKDLVAWVGNKMAVFFGFCWILAKILLYSFPF